jgi:hypothetical protein
MFNRTNLSVCPRTLIGVTAVALVLQSGCVTLAVPPAPSQGMRDSLGVVAIVPAQSPPDSNFVISWRHKEGAAGKQASLTAGAGLAATAPFAAVPVAGPVLLLSGVIATAIMSALDAVRTSEGIVPANTAAEIESAINQAVADLNMQDALAGRLATIIKSDPRIRLATADVARSGTSDSHDDHGQLRPAGIDTVIEVAIDEIGFDGCIMHDRECRPPHILNLFMRAQMRLVRVADGTELFARPLEYRSGNRELARWIADDGRLLGAELEQAYRELAERIYDEVFLVADVALPFRDGIYEPRCWLLPLHPKAHGRIDTLRPTLRWTAFPREIDRQELDPAVLGKISDVTYDLRIWDEAVELHNRPMPDRWRNQVFYERTGLNEPQLTLEVPLAPASRYYWSFRARFVIDGRSMATRWARASHCLSDEVRFGYYPFETLK